MSKKKIMEYVYSALLLLTVLGVLGLSFLWVVVLPIIGIISLVF